VTRHRRPQWLVDAERVDHGAALSALAALVAYSRIHTGVHFPADVVVGALMGTACAQTATRAIDRHRRP
jgi:membrane-associated phospholipid phosphatase